MVIMPSIYAFRSALLSFGSTAFSAGASPSFGSSAVSLGAAVALFCETELDEVKTRMGG